MTDDETEVVHDPDAAEIVAHFDHEGYRVTRYGTGPVDVHVYCEACDVRFVIEDIPRERFEAGMDIVRNDAEAGGDDP